MCRLIFLRMPVEKVKKQLFVFLFLYATAFFDKIIAKNIKEGFLQKNAYIIDDSHRFG